ncbi:MAG: exonuclease [Streptosporangiales bacterium]|nr:exonuclease [Streptosporangiales bacterium]
MLSLGASVAGTYDADGYAAPDDPRAETWYAELRPISDDYVPEAMAVSGLDRDELRESGRSPEEAMTGFAAWVDEVADRHDASPVFAAYPLGFDWLFTYWYLMSFAGRSPFGHGRALDVKTLYAARARTAISRATKRHMPAAFHPDLPHTHNALDDAVEQAGLLANIMRWR